MNSTENKYITDLVKNDYLDWKLGENIIFNSDTNTGKTTFIFKLADYCSKKNKRILYLISRDKKKNEMIKEITERSMLSNVNYSEIITVILYQKLEALIGRNAPELDEYCSYNYIYADECHYFINDSSMADNTSEMSLQWILQRKNAIKIYASATADYFFEKLIDKYKIPPNRIYSIKKSYDYVDAFVFYEREYTTSIIDNILVNEPNSKILFFVKNTESMQELFSIYGYAIADYLCSKSTSDKTLKRICNMNNEEEIVINKRILFTTKTLDVGVNIIDANLKHIICQLYDIDTIMQCFGRKRPQENDYCTFYLEIKQAHDLVGIRNIYRKSVDFYEEYKNDPELFRNKYSNNRGINKNFSVLEYTIEKGVFVNKVRLRNYYDFLKYYDDIKNNGFIKTVKERLDEELQNKTMLYSLKRDAFLDSLEEFENKKLYEEDKKKLIKLFKKKMTGFNIKKKTYGLKVLNSFLDKNYKEVYEYRLSSQKDKKRRLENGEPNPYHGLNYWILG